MFINYIYKFDKIFYNKKGAKNMLSKYIEQFVNRLNCDMIVCNGDNCACALVLACVLLKWGQSAK